MSWRKDENGKIKELIKVKILITVNLLIKISILTAIEKLTLGAGWRVGPARQFLPMVFLSLGNFCLPGRYGARPFFARVPVPFSLRCPSLIENAIGIG